MCYNILVTFSFTSRGVCIRRVFAMGKKVYRDRTFSIGTQTADGSCVKDNVRFTDFRRQRSHEAIMRKVERNKAKFSG